MCLVVCKARQAAPFLRLSDDNNEPPLESLEFARKLLEGLDAAMKADLEPDRVAKAQILALMHLPNDGPGGLDRSSGYLSQALSEAWALTLHCSVPGKADEDQCDYLWWSLRNLDRLNKPVMSAAPFLVDDTDIGIARIVPRKESYRSQVMNVSMILGDLMTTATRVYKASSTMMVDDCHDFPSMTDLTSDTSFSSFHQSHKGYLEIWYHVAAVLSCRYSGPGTLHYSRRLSSSDRILAIMTDCDHESLPPLPLIPYAASMSTTVIYRAFRDGERDVDATLRDLHRCYDALEGLSRQWTNIRGVLKMVKRLCKHVRASTLNTERYGSNTANQTPRMVLRANGTTGSVNQSITDNGTMQRTQPLPTDALALAGVPLENAGPAPAETTESWSESGWGPDVSNFQLDWAIQDMFDYGMPNVFRDPMTWNYSQMMGEDNNY